MKAVHSTSEAGSEHLSKKHVGCSALPGFAEKVQKRAYFLYMQTGARDGHDIEHWLSAEKQEEVVPCGTLPI